MTTQNKAVANIKSVPLNTNNRDKVEGYLKDRIQHFPRSDIHKELEELDGYYHLQTRRELDESGQVIERYNSRYEDIDLGIVNPNAETDVAFYQDTFLSSAPIFSAVSKKDQMDTAKQVDAKISKDQNEFDWVAELTAFFRNIAKHNKGLVEVSWDKQIVAKQFGGLGENGEMEEVEVKYEGNRIKNLSLYNTFWDTSVPLSKLADRGEYAGYVELFTYIELAELEDKLNVTIPDEVWKSAYNDGYAQNGKFYTPEIFKEKQSIAKGEVDWLSFAGYSTGEHSESLPNKFKDVKRLYMIHTFYARVIPAILGLTVPTSAHKPQIFKFVMVNGHLILAEHQTNFHNRLAIVGTQVVEDDTELLTMGPAQISAKYQHVSKELLDRQFAIMDRMIADRGLYDPQLVDSESISSAIPDAKIPARPSALNGLQGAYMPIPFQPNGMFELSQLMQTIKGLSEESTGINKAQQGQFVKGNKTLGEWTDVMEGANARPYGRAMVLESTALAKIKFLVKSNILQYQKKQEIYSEETGEIHEFDPAMVRKNIVEIKLTDGLKSASKMLKTGGLEYMLQLILQVPQFSMEYDAGGVFAHLLMQGKGIDIRDYKLTQEQKIAQQQQLALQNQQTKGPVGGQNG